MSCKWLTVCQTIEFMLQTSYQFPKPFSIGKIISTCMHRHICQIYKETQAVVRHNVPHFQPLDYCMFIPKLVFFNSVWTWMDLRAGVILSLTLLRGSSFQATTLQLIFSKIPWLNQLISNCSSFYQVLSTTLQLSFTLYTYTPNDASIYLATNIWRNE